MSTAVAALLAAVYGPQLHGAACAGLAPTFDAPGPSEDTEEVDERNRLALRVCASCPVLNACRDWLNSLPPRERPAGVVAGAVYTERGRAAA